MRRIEALLAAAALLAGACSVRGQSSSAAAATGSPGGLRVVRGALEDRFALTGELEAVSSENLVVPRTPVWELAIRWLVADGTRVKKGDRVVEFDASSFASALGDKRLAVIRAEGELQSEIARAGATLADKRMELDRRRAELEKANVEASVPADLHSRRQFQEKELTLARQRDALAKAEDDLTSNLRAARLEQKVKQIALERAERELRELEDRLGELTLRAPRDGLVQIGENPREGRKFLAGDQSWPGWPVASLPELGAMQVRARLSDVDDGAVREGMAAACVLDAYPDRVWKGMVRQVSAMARTEGRSTTRRFFDVLISIDGPSPDLMRPGMSARIEVIRRRAKDVLLVPRVALHSEGGKTFVRLGGGGVEAVHGVETEWCTELTCVVRSGVLEGTTLRPQPGAPRGSS
jgi:HlyD family secretion protein